MSAEQFFDTCQEFGIEPDEVVKNEILCKAANSFNVDLHASYLQMAQRLHVGTSKESTSQERQENAETTKQQQHESISHRFNLKSMGVDPTKLKSLDPRRLQSILSKANVSTGLESQQRSES